MLESRTLDGVHGGDECRELLRRLAGAGSDDHGLDLPAVLLRELLGRRERRERRLLQMAVGLLRYQEDLRHRQITFASSWSFFTSVATSGTLMPAARAGGASTRTTFTFADTSTPSAAGAISSIGFFLAFMMFGRLA